MRTPSPARQQRRPLTPLRTARVQSPRTPTRPAVIVDEDTSAGSSQSPTQNRTPTTVSPRRSRLTTAVYQSPAASTSGRRPSRDSSMDDWERMLDTTQPISPVAAAIARRIPDDFLPAAAPTSDSRLARVSKPFRSLRQSHETRPRPSTARPLGPAKSCTNLDSAGRLAQPVRQHAQLPTPPRRAFSEHSVFHPTAAPLAAPANSVTAIAPPLARQQPAAAPAAVPVPRIPRTTRPASSSSGPVALSASGSATRQRPTAPSASATPAMKYAEFSVPHTVVGTQRTGGPTQRNVTLVSNPEDYDEGEILKKKLTLECKINGHLWNLSVTFALKADRADLIRFAPKRVRIDDQTLWEETENWSQTSLTPVTGPRTLARGSTSYDQVLLQPVQPLPTSSTVSTQTPPYVPETTVRVAPKNIATASTASSGSRSKSTDKSQKGASKRSSSSNSKSGEKKKLNNTPFV